MATVHVDELPDPATDAELIQRTLNGEEAAYGLVVDRYQRKVFRVAYAIVRDEMEADLITQDTFVKAYMNLARFEQRSELETWLTRIAINRGRDFLRGRKFLSLSPVDREGRRDIHDPIDERPDAEREAIGHQIGLSLERALSSLSPQQKIIFRLRHYEERSLEEIGRLLDLRPGTVRAHLFRALKKLRHELADWVGNEEPA